MLWQHPASDLTPLLMVVGAGLEVASSSAATTQLPLEKFIQMKQLEPGNLLLAVTLPHPQPGQQVRAYRQARRRTADLAVATLAVAYQQPEPGRLHNARQISSVSSGSTVVLAFCRNMFCL